MILQFSDPAGGAGRLDLRSHKKNKKIPRAEGAWNFWGSKNAKKRVFCAAGAKIFGQTDLNITDFWSAQNHLIKPPMILQFF